MNFYGNEGSGGGSASSRGASLQKAFFEVWLTFMISQVGVIKKEKTKNCLCFLICKRRAVEREEVLVLAVCF